MISGAWSRGLTAIAEGIAPESGPVLWKPNAGPQTDACHSLADELFYGGAAGGGKSDLLLGLGIQSHTRSVIFRREYPQTSDLMDRAAEIVGGAGRLKRGSPGRLTLPGRTVQFGSCPHEKDKTRWQGRAHDLKGFDEVTHFTRPIFIYLKTWVRSAIPEQRTRVVATGNPPTDSDGAWVIDYWAPWLDRTHENPARPGELRWFVTTRDGKTDVEVDGPDPVELQGEVAHPRSRTFIPALLEDNPYLSDDPDYLAVIQSLPEPLRSQLLYGDFDIGAADDQWQVIPSEWLDLAVHRWEAYREHEAIGPMNALGVDVARGGADASVFAAKHGDWFAPLEMRPGKECRSGREVAAAAVALTSRSDQPVVIGIDVIGVGSSPYDLLVDANADVLGINFGEGSEATDRSGKYRMANVRAECYWGFREALDPEHSRLCIPPDPDLRRELLSTRWRLSTGRIFIESKDDIKARLGRSPDRADALVLSWYAGGRSPAEFW
jgi:hypothetical protein